MDGTGAAPRARQGVALTDQDPTSIELACQRLVYEFGRQVDANTPGGVADLFTPDAVLVRGSAIASGRQEIGASIAPAPAGMRRLHIYTNLVITVQNAAAAAGTCYYQAYQFDETAMPAELSPSVIGHITDRYVRLDGRWLIGRRDQARIARSRRGEIPAPQRRDTARSGARVAPVSDEDYRDIAGRYSLTPSREGSTSPLNITKTWAHHPALMEAQRPYQMHLRNTSVLPRRDQEIVVLRIGWRCGSEYEFGQHAARGPETGLSVEDIARLTEAGDAPGWDEHDRLLVAVADELYDTNGLSDTTWRALSGSYDTAQIIELLVLIGRYWTVSIAANTLRIQLEPGKSGFPQAAGTDPVP